MKINKFIVKKCEFLKKTTNILNENKTTKKWQKIKKIKGKTIWMPYKILTKKLEKISL